MNAGPKVGALAVVLRDNQVILAKRRKEPDAGLWGFPGGHVEWGEAVGTAAARELAEETGVVATPERYLDALDLIRRGGDGSVVSHYLLVAVLCRYVSGRPRAVSEVADARWVGLADVEAGRLPLSDRVHDVLARARRSGA